MAKSKSQLESELKGWQYVYESAKRRGNTAVMEEAHEKANGIRKEMGTAKTAEQSQAELNGWGRVYNIAKRRGDTSVMAQAHSEANKIRAEQGWQYDEKTGKTYDPVIGPFKRTVTSRTNIENAKIWNPKEVKPVKPSTSSRLEQIAKDLGYGTERTLAGAAGAVEDAFRFASGYGNKLLSGITSLGGLAKNPLSESLSDIADNTLSGSFVDKWKQNIDERYQPSEFQRKLGGLNEAAGAMLPSLVAGAATGGLSAVPAIGKGASMTAQAAKAAGQLSRGAALSTMFPSVAGASTRQAINEGAGVDNALAYGALSGALELGTEMMFAGVPGIKGGVVSDVIQKASKNPIVNRVADTLGEGVEEVISGIVSPYLQRMTYNEQAELASSDELAESFLSGALLSTMMNAGMAVGGLIDGVHSQKNLQAAQDNGLSPQQVGSWKIYNDAGKQGVPFAQVQQSDTAQIIPEDVAYAAHAAGMNDAREKSLATTYDELEIPDVKFSDQAADILSKLSEVSQQTGKSVYELAGEVSDIYENQRAQAVQNAAEYVSSYQPQGVDIVGRDEYGRGGYRVSNNEQWYWDFYAKNGHKPTKSDIPQIAESLVQQDTSGKQFGFSQRDNRTLDAYRQIQQNVLNEEGFSRIKKDDDGEYVAVYNEPTGQENVLEAAQTAARPGVIENAAANQMNQTTRNAIDQIAKRVGVTVELSNQVSAAGEYQNGVIRINTQSEQPVQQIFVHELTHHLEQSGGYADLVDVIEQSLRRDGVDSAKLKDQIKSEYAARGVTLDDDGASREFVAKYAESYLFTDEASIERLANQNRSLAQRIKDWLHNLVIKLKGTKEQKTILEAEQKYQKALDSLVGQKNSVSRKTQYSLNSDFGQELDRWIKKPWRNVALFVGRTSDALKSIGVRDSGIYWDTGKIRKIIDKHAGMTVDVLKQVPQILEEPILIMQSKQVESRITMFGEVMDAQGKPVLAVLELQPNEKNGALRLDTIKVASAYGKDRVQKFVNTSDILYLNPDKKRTDTWLKSTRLQLPFALTKYGSIKTITYSDTNSNPQKAQGSSFDQLLRDAGYTEQAGRLAKAVERYGAIERGEMAARDVRLPTQMDENTKVRRFARTAAESSILTDQQAGEIGKAVAEGKFNYEPVPNQAARMYAQDVLSKGEQYAQDTWDRVVNNNRPASKNDIAVGEYLLKQAAEAGDTQRVVELTAQIAAEGTRAGQIVQAMSMLKRLDGVGQSIALDATLKKLQGDLDRGKSGVFLKVPDELRAELVKAKGETQRNQALDKIYENLAQQIPTKWSDKWNAWRYLSMLGNPRTHIRNVLGNAVFAPVVGAKNVVGAVLESGVSRAQKLAGKTGMERTKTIRGTLPLSGGKARAFAIVDFAQVQDIIKGGGKMNPSDMIREKQSVFRFKPLESLRKANFNALEAEDGLFLKGHYVRSMVQYLQANKVNMDSFNPNGSNSDAAMLQKARDYAIKEAQKATYRDFSRAAQAISSLSRNAGSGANILIEGILPFKKTPINVLKRGIEYSPAGLLDSITRGGRKLAKGEISANEFIDRLSAGMTGTAISALGMLLFRSGVLVGGPDDDKEAQFLDSLGAQSYAIQWDGKSYTIDWLAPASMPLFVGVEMQRLADTFDGLDGRVVYDSVLNLAEPMTKMSMLDGLNSSITSVRYGDDPLSDMATNAVISYVGQAVPTLFGQIARTVDDTARTTYINKTGGLPDSVQRALQKNQNKIPGLSQRSIAYRDVFGRAEKDESLLSRAIQNFISPGYFSEEKVGAMEEELIRLYQSTGDAGTLPSMPAKYFNVGSERKDLTAQEYEKFSYARGSVLYSSLSELTQNNAYKKMDDADKASVVSDIIQLSNSLAKTEVSDYQLDGWQADAKAAVDAGISVPKFILIRNQSLDISGYKDEGGDTVANSSGVNKMYYLLTQTDLTPSQRQYMAGVLNIGKTVQGYSPEKVKQEYKKLYQTYGT